MLRAFNMIIEIQFMYAARTSFGIRTGEHRNVYWLWENPPSLKHSDIFGMITLEMWFDRNWMFGWFSLDFSFDLDLFFFFN